MLTLAQLCHDISAQTPFHQRWIVGRVVPCTLLEFSDFVADPMRESELSMAIDWLTDRVCTRYRERYGNPLLIWLAWTIVAAAISVVVQKLIEWWIDHHHTDDLLQLCERVMQEEIILRR